MTACRCSELEALLFEVYVDRATRGYSADLDDRIRAALELGASFEDHGWYLASTVDRPPDIGSEV